MTRRSVVLLGDLDGAVVGRIEDARSDLTVVRSCSELSEVLACVASGIADAVLLVGPVQDLTRSLLDSFRRQGVPVIMLGEPTAADSARGLLTVPLEAGVPVLEQALDAAAEDLARGPVDPAEGEDVIPEDLGVPSPETAGEPVFTSEEASGPGQCLVVWGPWGAPGTTTVALNLAGELAAAGVRVCLVDANTYAASCAAGLGLLEETSGLARACRAAERGVLDAEALEEACDQVQVSGTRLHLLTGTTRADRWIEIRPAPFSEVLAQARKLFEVVLVEVAPSLEEDEEASFEPTVPQRNGAALTALKAADRILAVGQADPVSTPRLFKGLSEMEERGVRAPVEVVVNRWRKEAVGARPQEDLEEAWHRFGTSAPIIQYLPEDALACDRARLRGSLLMEDAPRSSLRQGLQELARQCTPAGASAESPAPPGPADGTAGLSRMWSRLRRSRGPET